MFLLLLFSFFLSTLALSHYSHPRPHSRLMSCILYLVPLPISSPIFSPPSSPSPIFSSSPPPLPSLSLSYLWFIYSIPFISIFLILSNPPLKIPIPIPIPIPLIPDPLLTFLSPLPKNRAHSSEIFQSLHLASLIGRIYRYIAFLESRCGWGWGWPTYYEAY